MSHTYPIFGHESKGIHNACGRRTGAVYYHIGRLPPRIRYKLSSSAVRGGFKLIGF